MSMYLFDEQPILANKTLAREIGLNEALVLQLINCWIKINKRSGNNYFEGISKNPKQLMEISKSKENILVPTIKDPFTFEFLGLDAKESVSKTDLEQALMDNLQEFMLELGQGFCFGARQKRIIIDDKYYFVDLVFYNRIFHCNVIIELKNDEFRHEDLGQLNAYVGYYKNT